MSLALSTVFGACSQTTATHMTRFVKNVVVHRTIGLKPRAIKFLNTDWEMGDTNVKITKSAACFGKYIDMVRLVSHNKGLTALGIRTCVYICFATIFSKSNLGRFFTVQG